MRSCCRSFLSLSSSSPSSPRASSSSSSSSSSTHSTQTPFHVQLAVFSHCACAVRLQQGTIAHLDLHRLLKLDRASWAETQRQRQEKAQRRRSTRPTSWGHSAAPILPEAAPPRPPQGIFLATQKHARKAVRVAEGGCRRWPGQGQAW